MRKHYLGLLVSTTLLASGAALAGDMTKPGSAAAAAVQPTPAPATEPLIDPSEQAKMTHAGVVQSFNVKSHRLTLKDGSSFILEENLDGADLRVNDKIALSYKTDGRTKIVTDYKIEARG